MALPLPHLNISSVWQGISQWIAVHGAEHSCSAMPSTLRAGASPVDIAGLEASLGMAVPDDLLTLLSLVDGQTYDESVHEFPCAPFGQLLSCETICHTYKSMDEIVDSTAEEFGLDDVPRDFQVPADHIAGSEGSVVLASNDRWIPFAQSANGEGGAPLLFVLDLDPPEGVAPGRVLAFGCEDSLSIMAPSLRDFLADILAAMRRRTPEGGDGGAGDDGDDGAGPPPSGPAAGSGSARHRKVLVDDGPRIWYRYRAGGDDYVC